VADKAVLQQKRHVMPCLRCSHVTCHVTCGKECRNFFQCLVKFYFCVLQTVKGKQLLKLKETRAIFLRVVMFVSHGLKCHDVCEVLLCTLLVLYKYI